MATRRPNRSQARLFAQLIDQLEPEIHRAFMASVTDLQANVDWRALLEALGRTDIEGAIAALNINEAAWAEYSSKMTQAYALAGASTAAQIQAQGLGGIGTRFRMTNPGAQEWIRQNVANRVVGFSEEQTQVARMVIEAGFGRGQGPRNIAVDLAGRVQGGSRAGGVLGLDAPRAARLQAVTQGMRTADGVRDLVIARQDGKLALRYKVNAATEQRIIRAYKAGTAVPEADRAISERQYSNALLKARADTVANTETANAVMSGRMEQWRQLIETKGIDPESVIKTWHHRRGASKDHRPDHLAMSGKSVRGLFTPFVFPDGAQLQYAHDPDGGAKHVIGCGCDTTFRVDHSVGLE
ncbi:hypothetical protein EGT81_12785 [Alcaligenes faecalis]|uniref:hypothetical protein n=1 Tax=Alcaligenes faecalis TaxID=511 RepID=UPI000F65CC87|nr:hypothetical protein [Alcaligenes faecalis]RSE60400.1 hypothetical protein EGT81_12785 [Alcaligenes faecalis]